MQEDLLGTFYPSLRHADEILARAQSVSGWDRWRICVWHEVLFAETDKERRCTTTRNCGSTL